MAGPPAAAKSLNKLAVHLAGHRLFPLWSVLRHRGRKSGKGYAVPVAVVPTDDAFLIGLPWGRGSDWVRNTVAAGGCDVRWKGRDFACTEPEFVEKEVALAASHGLIHAIIKRQDFDGGFIRLRRRPTA